MKKYLLILLYCCFAVNVSAQNTACPPDKPLLKRYSDGDLSCESCDSSAWINIEKEVCDLCPNRVYINGVCQPPCPANEINTEGSCEACFSDNDNFRTTEAECKKCSNRDPFFSGIEGLYYCLLKCPEDKPIRDEAGYCQYSCDEERNFKTVKEECARCPNRLFQEIKALGDGIGECFLKPKDTCPPEKPIKFENLCLSCEQEEGSYIENCSEICPGYHLLNRKCVRSICPPEAPIRSREGKCLPCTGIDKYNRWEQGKEHDVIPVWSKDEEGKCPERSLVVHDNKYFLYKKDILKEGTFLSLDYASQKIYPCDYEEGVITSKEFCDMCPNREMLLYGMNVETCVLKCPDDKPLHDTKTKKFECFSCDDTRETGDINGCSKCPHRHIDSYSCVLTRAENQQ